MLPNFVANILFSGSMIYLFCLEQLGCFSVFMFVYINTQILKSVSTFQQECADSSLVQVLLFLVALFWDIPHSMCLEDRWVLTLSGEVYRLTDPGNKSLPLPIWDTMSLVFSHAFSLLVFFCCWVYCLNTQQLFIS